MIEITELYEQLISKFVKWAENQEDIRASIIIGSRARVETVADEWSDLDLIIVTSSPERYTSDTRWLDNLGKYHLTFLEKTATGDGVERRVLFDGGLDVDFPIIPLNAFRNHTLSSDDLLMLSRGWRILIDKDNELASISKKLPEPTKPAHPSPIEFDNCVNDFFYHAVLAVKKFKRGEHLYAKSVCDTYMKRLLLKMISWHARAKHGLNYDVWHDGRFFEKWADPEFVKDFRKVYAVYSEDDFQRALKETMNLFRHVAIETAKTLNYSYPVDGDEYAVSLIENYFYKD